MHATHFLTCLHDLSLGNMQIMVPTTAPGRLGVKGSQVQILSARRKSPGEKPFSSGLRHVCLRLLVSPSLRSACNVRARIAFAIVGLPRQVRARCFEPAS